MDEDWLDGSIRTLEGLLDSREDALADTRASLESSTDDLFSVSLRSALTDTNNNTNGTGANKTDLAASDEWEGLGTNSSKASMDSLVAVETHEAGPFEAQNETGDQKDESGDSERSKILMSVAAIGAVAFGAFAATLHSKKSEKKETAEEKQQEARATDTDWVEVERRGQD